MLPAVITASFNNKESEIVIPENIYHSSVYDNMNSQYYFSVDESNVDDKKRQNILINPSELITKEQIHNFKKELSEYKPAYVIINFEDLVSQKLLAKLLKKLKSSIVIVICDNISNLTFKNRIMRFFFWGRFLFIYRNEDVAIKFEGNKIPKKYNNLIIGNSPIVVEDIINSIKTKKGYKRTFKHF